MKRAVVVGSGAGGATIARALQGTFAVTILEAGQEFRRFSRGLGMPDRLKRLGLLFDEREIHLLFPAMRVQRAGGDLVVVRGLGTGGTTTIGTGNALALDQGLRAIGIDLQDEFAELRREIPITTDHRRRWRPLTHRLFETCQALQLDPEPLPKLGDHAHCRSCGRCVFGCPYGIKWDSRVFLEDARERGAELRTGWRVRNLVVNAGGATGVVALSGWPRQRRQFFPADVVVLAAGGLGTPVILENSGVACEPRLFVDPVLCVAAPWPNARQNRELAMPFYVQREHCILSPYFDNLSYFFNRSWRSPARDTLSLMIKLADSPAGSVAGGRVRKTLSDDDRRRLAEAVELCTRIFDRLGVKQESLVLGTLNGGHPGGMVPLTPGDATSLHPAGLPDNVYVADASLFPESPGGPPSLTIMALAKRVAKTITQANSM